MTKNQTIELRLSADEKTLWLKCANDLEMTLSAWIRERCNARIETGSHQRRVNAPLSDGNHKPLDDTPLAAYDLRAGLSDDGQTTDIFGELRT